jgi:retron-type reverse transcriptase
VNPPPFLVSFSDGKAFHAALKPDLIETYWSDIERLIGLGLPPAASVRVLACLFGYSPEFVGALNRKPERYYRSFYIRKGSKQREIHAPKVGLKVIQKWLGWHLGRALKFDDAVYGFVAGRSAPMAAAVHLGANWVYSVDLVDFFPSTPMQKVADALHEIGYSNHAASLISSLCCYRAHLSQGSPASPVLSNLVFSRWDGVLKEIAAKTHSRYTRYADDIVFSGIGSPPNDLESQVRSVINDSGWKIAEGKERLSKLPQRLKVHGLLVHGAILRLTKGYRNRIRAISHLIERGRVEDADMPKFLGHLAYVRSVEKAARPR